MHVTFSTEVELVPPPNSGKKCEKIPEAVYLKIQPEQQNDRSAGRFPQSRKVIDFFSATVNLIKKDYKKTGLLTSCLAMHILFLSYRAYEWKRSNRHCDYELPLELMQTIKCLALTTSTLCLAIPANLLTGPAHFNKTLLSLGTVASTLANGSSALRTNVQEAAAKPLLIYNLGLISTSLGLFSHFGGRLRCPGTNKTASCSLVIAALICSMLISEFIFWKEFRGTPY